MSVKAKTRKRLVVLMTAAVGLTALGGGAWAYHLHRKAAWLNSERALGMEAAQRDDAVATVKHLAAWLGRHPNDVEALTAYAKERMLVESPDNSHVWDTITKLRRLVELQPDADGPRRDLMRLYARYGFATEALDTADAILAKKAGDVEAIKLKLGALIRLRRWEEAYGTTEGWAKLEPSNPEPVLRAMGLMAQMNRPAKEIQDRAKAVAAKDPTSPLSQLLVGVSYALTDDIPSAQKLMKQAAAQKPPTPEFGRLLVDQLNRAGLYGDSLELLQRMTKASDDIETRLALLRRMWETNQAAEVISLTDAGAGKLGEEAVAFRAMAFLQLGKAEEAKQALAMLQSEKGNTLAEAWVAVIGQQMDPASVDPRKLLELCQKAAIKDSEGGYLRYFMGQAYAQLDEGELAIEVWQRLATQNPTWSLPLIRLSDLRLSKGRSAMAMYAAQEAVRRSPGSALSAINLAKVWAANIENGQAEQPEKLLQLIENIRKEIPQEETTLSMQVSLLGSMGKKAEATAEINKVLAAKDAPSEQTLLRMAAVSQEYGLGMTDACFDRSERAHGVTANLAYARAINKFRQGAGPEGVAMLKAAREKSGKADDLEWELAWARILEVTQDIGAKDAWVKLADGHPSDRQIQQMTLSVRSTRSDREFIDRTIERLRKLTGDEGVTWKLARARWMLDGAKNDQDLAQTTVLLKDVIRTAEDLVEPRVLLAQAYERLNNATGAVEQLRAAAAADPSNMQVALYLSRLLQKRGEFDKAREELDRVAKGQATDVAQKRQAAVLLAQQGDAKSAIDLLQQGGDEKDGSGSLLLAMLYRQRNELPKAEAVVQKLLASNPDPVAVQFAADLYAQQGRRADADKALALLDGMKLKPGVKELLLADHACRYLGPDEAIKRFKAALAVAPDNATTWRALVGYYGFLGRGKEMADAVDAGLKSVPSDNTLMQITAQKDLLAAAVGDAEMRPLVLSYLSDARADAPALEGIRVIAASKQSGESPDQTAGKLRRIVDANPMYAPLQSILVSRYIRLNRTEEATQLASRAVQMFPNDPEPARLAAEAMSAAQRWSEALGFATAWRERSLANPLPADMAISTCLLENGQPAKAAETIAPYVERALATPDRAAAIIVQYATSLNAAGQGDKAAEILWPLAEKSADWRKVWMQASLRLPDAQAVGWLERVVTVIPADGQEERAVLAGAWQVLGARTKDSKAINKSNGIFNELLARPDVTPMTAMARGIAAEQNDDLPTAESAYRRALSMDPNATVAQNNLAMVLVKRGGDMSEALKLAQAAVASHPQAAALHDTLAQVQAKGKDVDGAIASLRQALTLEPNSLEWHLHLARVLLDGGRRKDADKVMQAIAMLPARRTPPSAQMQKELDQLRAELSKQSAVSAGTE